MCTGSGTELFYLISHETNLKKQGILPLTFENPADYDRITHDAKISTLGLTDLVSHKSGEIKLLVETGSSSFEISVKHSMSEDQLDLFRCGSALNMAGESTQ